MDFYESDHWYFGDYRGGLPGRNYSFLLYIVIVLLLVQIALTTEQSLSFDAITVWLDFALNLIELFFISDYVGKLTNSWARLDYRPGYLLSIFFSRPAISDLLLLMVLLTNKFENDSLVVIGAYILKMSLSIYYSSFRKILGRISYILSDQPTHTFFPVVLLTIVTYVFSVLMYVVERFNDSDHFGSIVRSFWFSIVTVTTIGYGDVTPPTSLGKCLAVAFGMLGIVCIALLTANILEANSRFDRLEASSLELSSDDRSHD
ncbi:MAG: potassium channel family protein [Synechococcus sp.]